MARKMLKCKDFYALPSGRHATIAVRQNVMPDGMRECGGYHLFLCPQVAFRYTRCGIGEQLLTPGMPMSQG